MKSFLRIGFRVSRCTWRRADGEPPKWVCWVSTEIADTTGCLSYSLWTWAISWDSMTLIRPMLGDLSLISAIRLNEREAIWRMKPRVGGKSLIFAFNDLMDSFSLRPSDSCRVASRRVCRFMA